jgi:copper resistance protein C
VSWRAYVRPRSHLALVVVAVAMAFAAAVPAAAHTSLVGSDPADGANLSTAPTAVTLTFNSTVRTEFAQVAVLDANGTHHEQGAPQVDGATVNQALGPLRDGQFQISYRVVAADGHPVTGTLSFSVAQPASPPATTVPTPVASPTPVEPIPVPPATARPAAPEETTTTEVGVSAPWALLSTGIVLLLILSTGLIALRLRRAQRAHNGSARQADREDLSEQR